MFTKSFLRKCNICKHNLNQMYNYKQFLSTTSVSGTEVMSESSYTDSDKQKILKIINNCDLETLSRFKISKGNVNDLVKHRNSIGHFDSLTQIENCRGFSSRTARAFFNSIVDLGKQNTQRPLKLASQFLYPNLSSETEKQATSVASVHIDFGSISWSVINPERYELVEWNTYNLTQWELKKQKLADIIDIAWNTVQEIPMSSIYVLDSPLTNLRAPGNDPNNPKFITVSLQKQQLVAALVAFLTARNRSKSDLNSEEVEKAVVYFLKTSLASRLFKTLIGSEKVSSESTIKSIMSSEVGVKIPPILQNAFLSNVPYNKEMLGQCLLINLAFMEVCYYRNPESLKKLSRRS